MRQHLILASVLGIALMGGSLLLGDDQKPTARGRAGLPASWGKLGLTDTQKKEIYNLQSEYRAKIDDLQKQIDDLKKKERSEMLKVLTDAQKARLKEIAAAKVGADDIKNSKPEK